MEIKNKVLLLLSLLIALHLTLNGPLYSAQGSHEGHSQKESPTGKAGIIMKKDIVLDNIRVKIELVTMKAHLEAMGKEMEHEMPMMHKMPMGRHTHGKIVHDDLHRNLTHHFIVEVIDSKTDTVVKDAQVDLHLTYPKGQEKSLMLHTMTMKGVSHYAGDLNLSEKGNYLLDLSVTREGIEKKASFEVMIE